MFLEVLTRDVSYGARMLWHKPAYSAIARSSFTAPARRSAIPESCRSSAASG
jgi:hypothetical protein